MAIVDSRFGLAANRPASGHTGKVWRALDTGESWVWDGMSWVSMGRQDTSTIVRTLSTAHSPVARWTFADTLDDSTANALHLSLAFGTTRFANAGPGGLRGAFFDGATAFERASNALFQITGALTIQTIWRFDNWVTSQRAIVSYGNGVGSDSDAANNDLFGLSVLSSGPAHSINSLWENGNGTNVSATTSVGFVPLGRTFLLTQTRPSAGTSTKIYLDDLLLYTSGALLAPTGGTSASSKLRVGASTSVTQAMEAGAYCAGLKIIAAELDAAQVATESAYVRGVG